MTGLRYGRTIAAAVVFLLLVIAVMQVQRRDRTSRSGEDSEGRRKARSALSRNLFEAPSDGGPGGTKEGTKSDQADEGGGRGPSPRPRTGRSPASIRGTVRLPSHLVARREDLLMSVTRFETGGVMSNAIPAEIREDGSYALDRLAPGRYVLKLILDGSPISETRRVTVAEGQNYDGVDFDFAPVPSLHGRVFSEATGGPVAGAFVAVSGEPFGRTTDGGMFTLSDFPRDEPLDILVTHPDYAPARPHLDPGWDPASTLAVSMGPGASIVVRAVEGGTPVEGAMVTLYYQGHTVSLPTDSSGSCLLRGLTPSVAYDLTVWRAPKTSVRSTAIPHLGEPQTATVSLTP